MAFHRLPSRVCLSLLIALLPAAAAAHAAGATLLRTAAQTGTEPKYIAHAKDGKSAIVGLCVDIDRAIERIEPTLRIVGDQEWQPTARLEEGMAAGAMDIACGLSRNKEREAKFTYIEPPLFPVRYFLVARADDNVRIDSWDDVRRLGDNGVILIPHRFGPIARLKDMGGLTIDSGAPDSKTNLLKLVAGRGRFYYHRSPGIVSEIRKAGVEDKVKILPTVMDRQLFYMVVGKSVAPDAVEKLQRAIAALEKSGELKRLIDKWNEE
ncbi:MAG TPA: transporter substrate-binding domain-containing protein [Paucimonas sp.]|nr:transporter substrate-binding domain-containing protein [Paucimonas sp.]